MAGEIEAIPPLEPAERARRANALRSDERMAETAFIQDVCRIRIAPLGPGLENVYGRARGKLLMDAAVPNAAFAGDAIDHPVIDAPEIPVMMHVLGIRMDQHSR